MSTPPDPDMPPSPCCAVLFYCLYNMAVRSVLERLGVLMPHSNASTKLIDHRAVTSTYTFGGLLPSLITKRPQVLAHTVLLLWLLC